jgi:hypothetical protein
MESSTCASTLATEESHSSGSPTFRFQDNSLVEALYYSNMSNAQHSTRSDNTRLLPVQGIQCLHRLSFPAYDHLHATIPTTRDNPSGASSELSLHEILDEAINISNEILLSENVVVEAISRKHGQVKQSEKNLLGIPQ